MSYLLLCCKAKSYQYTQMPVIQKPFYIIWPRNSSQCLCVPRLALMKVARGAILSIECKTVCKYLPYFICYYHVVLRPYCCLWNSVYTMAYRGIPLFSVCYSPCTHIVSRLYAKSCSVHVTNLCWQDTMLYFMYRSFYQKDI